MSFSKSTLKPFACFDGSDFPEQLRLSKVPNCCSSRFIQRQIHILWLRRLPHFLFNFERLFFYLVWRIWPRFLSCNIKRHKQTNFSGNRAFRGKWQLLKLFSLQRLRLVRWGQNHEYSCDASTKYSLYSHSDSLRRWMGGRPEKNSVTMMHDTYDTWHICILIIKNWEISVRNHFEL